MQQDVKFIRFEIFSLILLGICGKSVYLGFKFISHKLQIHEKSCY
jgi:hypothetical protein